jgi:hypothetical protein
MFIKSSPWVEVRGKVEPTQKNSLMNFRFRFKEKNGKRKDLQIFSSVSFVNHDASDTKAHKTAQKIASNFIDGTVVSKAVVLKTDNFTGYVEEVTIEGWSRINKGSINWVNDQINWFLDHSKQNAVA